MVDKSNEYGYVPSSPTQARGANTGVFEVNDIVDLLNAEQWSGEFSKLRLIETQSQTSVSELDFTSIQESTYNVHLITFRLELTGTGTGWTALRMFESGTIQTGSIYDRINHQILTTTATYAEYTNSTNSYVQFHQNGIASGDIVSGHIYMFDAGKSGSFTPLSWQVINKDTGVHRASIGGGGLDQDSVVDGVRLFVNGVTAFDGEASIYGIEEST